MKIIATIRQWASRSDAEKVSLDRRMFLKGLAVTTAGLLVPTATLFDMGRVVVADPFPNIPNLDKQRLISEYIKSAHGRERLFASLTEPLRQRCDYAAIARKVFLVEELPSGAVPLYDKEFDVLR